MKHLFVVLTLVVHCSLSVAVAAEGSTLPAPYAAKFGHAVDLLEGYRGNASSLEVARAELDSVLKAHPRYAPAYKQMARYFIMKGHINTLRFQPGALEAADYAIKKALEINPSYVDAFVLRGHLYRLMGRHQAAVAALQKAENLGTTDPWLQNNWADLLIDEGKYDEAAQRYRKVIDSKTQNKNAMIAAFEGLVRYYVGVGKLDQADEVYRKQIDFEPNAAWGYGNYAQFLLCQRDDYEQSIFRSRQALSIMNYGVGQFWLASALYRKWAENAITGTPGKGKQEFLEAQAIYPDLNGVVAAKEVCPPLRQVAKAIARGLDEAIPAPQRGRP